MYYVSYKHMEKRNKILSKPKHEHRAKKQNRLFNGFCVSFSTHMKRKKNAVWQAERGRAGRMSKKKHKKNWMTTKQNAQITYTYVCIWLVIYFIFFFRLPIENLCVAVARARESMTKKKSSRRRRNSFFVNLLKRKSIL